MVYDKNNNTTVLFIISAVCLHVLLVISIFDVYFTSAVIQGLSPVEPSHTPPATRLVLFVADGLRANKLFGDDMINTPFLKNVALSRGVWGLSNTRVPTESRPGHVALIAGFYEDVASVTKGWQENAVEFDSLFNRSQGTWSWGSPDILPMFAKGAVHGRVHLEVYPADMEDFAAKNTSQLDIWVFDKVKEFFTTARRIPKLNKQLRENKVVFFLHLLGIDTSGHSVKPHSYLYRENIAVVDKGISEIERIVEEFYDNDKQTAYVFTADHGMTDWGSHGAGSSDETVVPLVVWGAGVNPPLSHNPTSFLPPGVNVLQADICPLMAALLATEIPTNSVGITPLDYLKASLESKVEIAYANTMQILNQFQSKRREKKGQSFSMTFTEFFKLSPSSISDRLRKATQLKSEEKYNECIELYQETAKVALEGIEYFHKYDRFLLGLCIGSTFVLWVLLVLTELLPPQSKDAYFSWSTAPAFNRRYSITNRSLVMGVLMPMLYLLLLIEDRPWSHWLYHTAPLVLVWILWARLNRLHLLIKLLLAYKTHAGFGLLLLEIMVWSFFYRSLLSLGILIIGIWPFFDLKATGHRNKTRLKILWILTSLCLFVFPHLPVIGGYLNVSFVLFGGMLTTATALYLWTTFEGLKPADKITSATFILWILLFLPAIASFISFITHYNIETNFGSSLIIRSSSWILLLGLVPLTMCLPTQLGIRLFGVNLALISIYSLMSILYENIFIFFLAWMSALWLVMESRPDDNVQNISWVCSLLSCKLSGSDESTKQSSLSSTNLKDIRRAVIFIFLLLFSFFGTGNIASINSFDPNSVYCFLTVFQPFIMGGLMFTKIMIPMLLVSCSYVSIQGSQLRLGNQALLAIALADMTALHFFFLIQDSGSWLQIGTSISHYLISMGTSVAALVFTLLAQCLLTCNLRWKLFSGISNKFKKSHVY